MSTQINIDNYESFYLDYLEGNLNETDTTLLFAFLETNPDLILEEDALAYLPEADFVPLDSQTKSNLKFPDTEQKIGLNNIEIFLIAAVEKQLSPEKIIELQQFINTNPSYAEELSLYQKSKLQADLSIIYAEKKRLKKGIIIPMYAHFAAVAASVVLVVSIINFNQNETAQHLASAQKNNVTVNLNGIATPNHKGSNAGNTSVDNTMKTISIAAASGKGENPSEAGTYQADGNEDILAAEDLNPLKMKPVKTLSNRPLFHEIASSNVPHFAENPDHLAIVPQNEYTAVEMKNPIKLITNRAASVLNTDVDFRTSKAAKKKTGGFLLKIGKFEISRKVYDNTSVAAINP